MWPLLTESSASWDLLRPENQSPRNSIYCVKSIWGCPVASIYRFHGLLRLLRSKERCPPALLRWRTLPEVILEASFDWILGLLGLAEAKQEEAADGQGLGMLTAFYISCTITLQLPGTLFQPQNQFLRSAQHLYEKREGSGSGDRSGSITLTNGSGSGRPKNMRILRIRIPNTAQNCYIELVSINFEVCFK